MSARSVLSYQDYQRVKRWTADYAEALIRTNLAVRCWLHRTRNKPDRSDSDGGPQARRVLAWLLGNHILQAFYRDYGIDVIPFTVDHMYGYGMAVRTAEGCKRKDREETAWIACGSVRVDTDVRPETQNGPRLPSIEVYRRVREGEDPLWVIDTAAIHAVGGRWPRHCRYKTCAHRRDADIYLTLNQIITLMLCMGYARDAILGTFVECSVWGEHPTDPPHPLRRLGFVSKPTFTGDFLEILLTNKGDSSVCVWIHRSSGELVTAEGELIPYTDWCGGDIDRGLEYLCHLGDRTWS